MHWSHFSRPVMQALPPDVLLRILRLVVAEEQCYVGNGKDAHLLRVQFTEDTTRYTELRLLCRAIRDAVKLLKLHITVTQQRASKKS